MPKIVRRNSPGDGEAKPISTEPASQPAHPSDARDDWWLELTQAMSPFWDRFWRQLHGVSRALELDETLPLIDLRCALPRELWLDMLMKSMVEDFPELVAGFHGEPWELAARLEGVDEIGLRLEQVPASEDDYGTYDDYEDGTMAIVKVFAGDDFIGGNALSEFFSMWESSAWTWLLHATEVSPSQIERVLERELPD